MKPEIKEKWLIALRSGEYKQTRNTLRIASSDAKESGDYSYCCLGVLCDLYIRETGLGKWDGGAFVSSSGTREDALLPTAVIAWAGMNSSSGRFGHTPLKDCLANVNDHSNDFNEVIEIIEKEF